MPLKKRIRDVASSCWFLRSRFAFLNAPVPCRLPYGGWFLAYGDTIGLRVLWGALSGHSYADHEWRFFLRFLRPGMTVFDIGANQGYFTILASRALGASGKVFAFEPAPPEFLKLRTNLRINRCRNVVAESQAIGCSRGRTEFHLCLDYQGSFSSIRQQARDVTSRRELIEVPITMLDEYVRENNLESVDLIKVDAEGGELDALKGATQVLRQLRPAVLCELADVRTRPWGYAARDIYSYLISFGYRWYRFTDLGNLVPAVPQESYDPFWENLVGLPQEKTIF